MTISLILLFTIIVAREYSFIVERREWARERQLLLNRIQRPEWIHMPSNDFEVPEPEVDEFNLVGSIK